MCPPLLDFTSELRWKVPHTDNSQEEREELNLQEFTVKSRKIPVLVPALPSIDK